jgi:hypothetical protein
MKEGDLITTYYAGFFRLEKIERRFYTEDYIKYFPSFKDKLGEEYSPLYHFTQEYDSNGKPKKSKQKSCDAQFCNLAEDFIKQEILDMEERKQNLEKLLEICG